MLIFFQYKTLSGLQDLRSVMGSSSFSVKVGCKEISEGPQWLGPTKYFTFSLRILDKYNLV